MKTIKTSGEYEVYFDNYHLCGRVVWDSSWNEWRFVPTPGTQFKDCYMKEIYKFMRKLK